MLALQESKNIRLGYLNGGVGYNLKIQATVLVIDKPSVSRNKLRYRLQTEFAF